MLNRSTILALGLFATGGVALANVPNMAPAACAWEKLPPGEQTRLRENFKVDLKDDGFTITFAELDGNTAADAARQCDLNLNPAQTGHMAAALSRRAAVQQATKGIADHGENPAAVELALAKMNDGKRERIGDALSCPGPHPMVREWDSSVMSAVRRANLRFQNGGAYSWVSLALYATMAQEGALRRMAGQADACT